ALDRLDESLSGRVDTMAADLRRTLSAGLGQATAGSRAAETAWSEARSALEERLAAIEDTVDGLAERLEAQARDSANHAEQRLTALHDQVATAIAEQSEAQQYWAENVHGALSELASAVDHSLG